MCHALACVGLKNLNDFVSRLGLVSRFWQKVGWALTRRPIQRSCALKWRPGYLKTFLDSFGLCQRGIEATLVGALNGDGSNLVGRAAL